MAIALTEDQVALATSVRQFVARHAELQHTRAEFEDLAIGCQPVAWDAARAQGLLGLALPEEAGGDGAGATELAVLLEEAAYGLFPGPLLSTLIASWVVSRHGSETLREQVIDKFVDGATSGLATTTTGLHAVRVDGGWQIAGTSAQILGTRSGMFMLLGADSAQGDVWFLTLGYRTDTLKTEGSESVDLTREMGRVTLSDHFVDDAWVLEVGTEQLRALFAVCFAAESVGVARWCQESGLAYAKVREQFGRQIGSFQAIKHKCARLYSQVELMTAAVWDAAVAIDQGDDQQAALTAAAAAALCLPGAADVALETVTLFGGIGYTWEHDAHLYWRRAISLTTQLGSVQSWEERLGELAGEVARERKIDLGSEPTGLRAEVAEQLAQVKNAPEPDRRGLLAGYGLVSPHYPRPYGRAADAAAQIIIAQEFEKAGMTQPSTTIGEWALPTILGHGSDAQRERFMMPTLRGELIWCQLFSEPGAGSDLASLRTKAERVEGGWKLNGQKVWTSSAHEADWGICLARTDPDAPKHKGISYFLVDMRSAGLEVRPLREANGGYLFNEVFFDDVFVPDDLLVGELNQGWRLARTTLGNERVSIGSGMAGSKDDPAELARRLGATDPGAARVVGSLTARLNAFEALVQRGLLRQLSGLQPGAESSILKYVSAVNSTDVKRAAMTWVGPGVTSPEVNGEIEQSLLGLPPMLIGGGTVEIQLNVISEQVLGLPRG